MFDSDRRPILVTGSHRSGTTWVGRMLSATKETIYVHEPFSPRTQYGWRASPVDYWFQFVCEENAQKFEQPLRRALELKCYVHDRERGVRSLRQLKARLLTYRWLLSHRVSGSRPIMKDPIAVFSAEWLSATFDMAVVVMIRNPAAFCSSLKIKNWTFDFNQFAKQPLLMERLLSSFAQEIEKFAAEEQDIVDQGILLWNCIHSVINGYRQRRPEWHFIRHEDLSREPAEGFKELFFKLGVTYSTETETIVDERSGTHNPVEQKMGSQFSRDSRKNVESWRSRLSPEEVDRVKRGTEEVARLFYCKSEW